MPHQYYSRLFPILSGVIHFHLSNRYTYLVFFLLLLILLKPVFVQHHMFVHILIYLLPIKFTFISGYYSFIFKFILSLFHKYLLVFLLSLWKMDYSIYFYL